MSSTVDIYHDLLGNIIHSVFDPAGPALVVIFLYEPVRAVFVQVVCKHYRCAKTRINMSEIALDTQYCAYGCK